MSNTVATKGIYTTAVLTPAAKATATAPARKSSLALEVDVIDNLVREQARGADNFERVRVGVPYISKGQVAWKEVPLQYQGQEILGYYQRDLADSHEAVVSNVNADLVKKHGVYVKLEYGDGSTVVWGQEFGKNTKPQVR